VGGTLKHGRRTSNTVEQRFFLTLDADYAKADFVLDTAITLIDIPHVIHTTWRHTPEAPRYRVIIPLSRGVEPNEYKSLAWTAMNRLGGEMFDVSTAQPERFMWSPSSRDPAEYFSVSAYPRAPYLPVDEWLDGRQGPSESPAAGGGGTGTTGTPASRSEALSASAEDRERAVEILLKACDAVEHVYERDDFAGRNEAVFHLMPLLFRFCDAEALDEDTVIEALWEAAQRVPADEPYERREFNASVRSARQYAFESGPVLPETTPTKLAQADFEDVDIEDLWTMTPRLKHLAQAADSDQQSRMALLMSTIVRILAEAPAGVCLPGNEDGYIRTRSAINLGVALVGSSGQGKSELIASSKKLLGRDQDLITGSPSTGQGLIQSFLQWDTETGGNVLIDDPRRIFISDEIDTLGALSKDAGSTLFGEMRTMLTGGFTGTSNATRERQRRLPAGSYNAQFLVGVQPARAGVLLEGRDAGTPQRFVWVQVTDPKHSQHWKDAPPWPGDLGWSDAFMWALDFDPIVRYPDWLLEELKEHRYRVSKESMHGGELSRHGHLNLLRLKVAAGIAFLHESIVIENLHIEIADMILAASKNVQRECEIAVAEAQFLKRKAIKRSEERVAAENEDEKLADLVKNARGALLRANGEWVGWHQGLRPRVSAREQFGAAVWDALREMEDVECEEKPSGKNVQRKARIKNEQ
jgi:hypothetical protein